MVSEDVERIEGIEETTTEKLKRQLREAAEKEAEQEEIDRLTREGEANYQAGLGGIENAEGYAPPEPSLLHKLMPGQAQPSSSTNRVERAKSRFADLKARFDRNVGSQPSQSLGPVPRIRSKRFQSPPAQAQPPPQMGGGLNLPVFTGESFRQDQGPGSSHNLLGGLPSLDLNLGQPRRRNRPIRGKSSKRSQASSLLSGLSVGNSITKMYYSKARRPKAAKEPRSGFGFKF